MKRNCRITRTEWLALAIIIVLGVTVVGRSVRADVLPGIEARLKQDITYLASDNLEGRGIGTDGLNLAAAYVKQQFADAGLDVGRIDGDAFQKFQFLARVELGDGNALAFKSPDGKVVPLEYDKDVRTCSFGGSGDFSGDLVFAGYGIDAPKAGYNDFDGIDVKGKVVVIVRKVPRQGETFGPFSKRKRAYMQHAPFRSKMLNAANAGAKAVLFVNDPYFIRKNAEAREKMLSKAMKPVADAAVELDQTDPDDSEKWQAARKKLSGAVKRLQGLRTSAKRSRNDALLPFSQSPDNNPNPLPAMHITQEACNRVLAAALNTSLAKLETAIDRDMKPRSTVLKGWSAEGKTAINRVRVEVKNVLAVLEGEGPLADETIVLGAHYDHLGRGGFGSLARGSKDIHNGADDNASGTVALLEIARRLAGRQEKLPRRLVFIAFTAEERGLVGSARYTKNPLYPLDKTIAMFNMDMVGRLTENKLIVHGTGTAPRWNDIIDARGKAHDLKIVKKPEGQGPSDQTSFYLKKIPVLHFFTGLHSDYHRPSDDTEKINVSGMIRIIDLIEEVVVETAKNPKRPKYLATKTVKAQSGSRPSFGSVPDFGSEAKGYAISGTSPGSPADKAGFKGGDVIVKFGKYKISNLTDFHNVLLKFAPGDEVTVELMRDGKKLTLKAVLDRPK